MQNINLTGKVLGILTVVAYAISFLLGRDTVIGSSFSVLGLLLLVFTIVAFFREWKQKKV